MPSKKKLKSRVVSEVSSITKSRAFKAWIEESTFPKEAVMFVAINNSFLFREGLTTTKSTKYIAFDILSSGKFNPKRSYVVDGLNFNTQFKLFINAKGPTKTDLETAIEDELKNIGEVVYTLVGDIQDVNEISESLHDGRFKSLILKPNLNIPCKIEGDSIYIKEYTDKEFIWNFIKNFCDDHSIKISNNLPGIIDRAIDNLQKNAFADLILPKRFNNSTKYLLDKISDVIEGHLEDYKTNVLKMDSDPLVMNDILRISYNFVSDINKLLVLVVHLCDLKPIILWLTMSKYFDLDEKFKNLPFGFTKKKPSLKTYEQVIKNARNKSFHKLFPFNKAMRFEMEALRNVEVKIFSSFAQRDGNSMKYQDQKLLDLLRGFTRVNEQVVSNEFWKRNEDVMRATMELIKHTSESIKLTR